MDTGDATAVSTTETVPEPISAVPIADDSLGNTRGTRRGRPPTHGLHTMKQAVRCLGSRTVDRRTALGKQLAAWRAAIIEDLGGNPSTAQRAIIDLALRSKLMLDSIDAWLLTQPSLVDRRS